MKNSENMHEVLLFGYLREELQQRIRGGECPGKAPLGPARLCPGKAPLGPARLQYYL